MLKININEFLRRFDIRPNLSFSLLLGAGTSVQAGIPSANMLTWLLKRKLYCTILKIHEDKFRDIELSDNQRIIQSFLNSQRDCPSLGSLSEYSFYFQKCYPNEQDRKFFVQNIVSDKKASLGHICLAELVLQNKVGTMFTTNFDELIECGIKTIDPNKSFVVISTDNINNINQINSSLPKILKLHGDYRYDFLQNTDDETKKLNSDISQNFIKDCNEKGLIVVGYSGRDNSVVDALEEAMKGQNPFPHGLIWCLRREEAPSPRIEKIINDVNSKNSCSGFLEINDFDDFLYRIYQGCNCRNSIIDNLASVLLQKRKPFVYSLKSVSEVIKLNGIRVKEYPKTICSFDTNIVSWGEMREITDSLEGIFALCRSQIQFWGDKNEIVKGFDGKITSEVSFRDIEKSWVKNEDSVVIGMFYDLIDKSLQDKYKLKRVFNSPHKRKYYCDQFKVNASSLRSRIPSHYELFESFEVQLSFFDESLWFVLLPTVYLRFTGDYDNLSEAKKLEINYERQRLTNEILSNRYNKEVNEKLAQWKKYLNGIDKSKRFECGQVVIKLEDEYSFKNFIECEEPQARFHVSDNSMKIVHPLKGLKNWGPFDSSLYYNEGHLQSINLALISPCNCLGEITTFLNQLNLSASPKSEEEYLIDYHDFSSIYKKTLHIPNNGSNLIALVDNNEVQGKDTLGFYDLLKRKVDYFDSLKTQFDILIIYIPKEWAQYRELKNQNLYYDLHDSIKIYCAKKNIKLQIIEESSLNYFDQSKVRWWLSLGLYAKANGIPWKINRENNGTAFIGIGYAVRQNDVNGRVVMGCSQIFDETGQGFRFLLSPLEHPIFKGKNPFMGREDARRLFLTLKEAYFRMDPNMKLKKVVVHKSNHFTHEEMEGIAQALEGIDNVELLQIQYYTKWRGIRGDMQRKQPHPYPVKRGTVMPLDDFHFLLWTHGAVVNGDIIKKNYNYYQGKRGIPKPLLIKRFRGQDSLTNTAQEILNLTKMNWNSGQLYKILPVTLDFSKRLSQMAKQTESFHNRLYDFRFFM